MAEKASALFAKLREIDRPAEASELADGFVRMDLGEPSSTEDPLNAVIRRCSVRHRDPSGPLEGKRIGVKNNIAVAGLPMTCGSLVLREYLPDEDATVVIRVVDAGAEVVALLNMDDLASSATGETSAFGPIRNPHNPSHLAGGSSGGSAAALFYEDIDLTLGCDQGGSVRIPASWCGIVGLRPTFGLVPYTGILSGEPSLDSVGPMARTVGEVAQLLEVIAGNDSLDPRQSQPASGYSAALDGDVKGLRVGILTEGFGLESSEQEVDTTVLRAMKVMSELGIDVGDVSIPQHRLAYAVNRAIDLEGGAALLFAHGLGYGWQGRYQVSLGRALGQLLMDHPGTMSSEAKFTLVIGGYLIENSRHSLYARAQNHRQPLRRAYDSVLGQFDLLAMPTVPFRAPPCEVQSTWSSRSARESGAASNTGPFSATGHPSISIPCGTVDGLPVGLMLVSRHFDESLLLRVAHAFEQSTHGGGAIA